mmetsp:Transcript_6054/g.9184  ORF Transcript_6054/g.9184 Transcript_6054/m.9184 type:complete len:392 (-) Transcript_6054:231-1406(-)
MIENSFRRGSRWKIYLQLLALGSLVLFPFWAGYEIYSVKVVRIHANRHPISEIKTESIEDSACYPIAEGWGEDQVDDADRLIRSANSTLRTEACAEKAKIEMNESDRLSPQEPLVAVCLVGNVRTLPTLGVLKRLEKNLLKMLSSRTLVFTRLKLDDAPFKEQPKHGGFSQVPAGPSAIVPALKTLRPVWAKITQASGENQTESINPNCQFTKEGALKKKDPDLYVGRYNKRLIRMMHAMFECYDAVVEFEKTMGRRFEAIVKVRPDVAWIYPAIPASDWVHNRPTIVSHLSDQFIFSPRKFSDGFRDFWEQYQKCSGEWEGRYIPERIYEEAFKERGATYYEDKRIPQVVRRLSKHEPSAALSCGRQKRVTNLTLCLELVYDRDELEWHQ